MALRESIEKQGNWLFRWRSYFPLLGIPILLIALRNSGYIEKVFGDPANTLWGIISVSVSFLGFGIRFVTAGYVSGGTSGRNTKSQVADALNTTGMYSIVRNPLYLGNFIIILGLILFIQVWWCALLACFGFWIYYERIIFAEEEFLRKKFGDTFLNWAKKTPVFFPKFSNWKKPSLPFSARTALRREFPTFFATAMSFFILAISADLITKEELKINIAWVMVLGAGFIAYAALYFLKKKTRILHVPGR
ncbi:MAG: methyltransferase [Candidatus Omnitrophota bacterium]|nr:methyltransferase [Candidatus Omnitrophota bacterium]